MKSLRKSILRKGNPAPESIRQAYSLMRTAHGHQGWWPGETPFEVCIGAILTQNTAWTHVERAIRRLREAGVLSAKAMAGLEDSQLAELIRPAGYFNLKARRLKAFLGVLINDFQGDLSLLFSGPTPEVRARLLAIPGIGPETADSMLLYAGNHLRFVVDAYTLRIFSRHGWCRPNADYAELQGLCAEVLVDRPIEQLQDYWQDYHAQLVRIGKDYCRPQNPRCETCPLRSLLPPTGPLPSLRPVLAPTSVVGQGRSALRRRGMVGMDAGPLGTDEAGGVERSTFRIRPGRDGCSG